ERLRLQLGQRFHSRLENPSDRFASNQASPLTMPRKRLVHRRDCSSRLRSAPLMNTTSACMYSDGYSRHTTRALPICLVLRNHNLSGRKSWITICELWKEWRGTQVGLRPITLNCGMTTRNRSRLPGILSESTRTTGCSDIAPLKGVG